MDVAVENEKRGFAGGVFEAKLARKSASKDGTGSRKACQNVPVLSRPGVGPDSYKGGGGGGNTEFGSHGGGQQEGDEASLPRLETPCRGSADIVVVRVVV